MDMLFFLKNSGSHLLSRAVPSKVPSAAWALTIVFGMGTGVSPRRIATRSSSASSVFLFFFLAWQLNNGTISTLALRKEVIQPHLPIRLPCYDFTPVNGSTFGSSPLSVGPLTSGISISHGVTGGVYKTRERIHRGILIRDY